jgi:hypothetical protein
MERYAAKSRSLALATGPCPSNVLEPDTSTLAKVSARVGYSIEEFGMVLQAVVDPGILVRKADQHAGGPAMARDHYFALAC